MDHSILGNCKVTYSTTRIISSWLEYIRPRLRSLPQRPSPHFSGPARVLRGLRGLLFRGLGAYCLGFRGLGVCCLGFRGSLLLRARLQGSGFLGCQGFAALGLRISGFGGFVLLVEDSPNPLPLYPEPLNPIPLNYPCPKSDYPSVEYSARSCSQLCCMFLLNIRSSSAQPGNRTFQSDSRSTSIHEQHRLKRAHFLILLVRNRRERERAT